jgi:oligopeptide/dipeptide ABC transporter ATP-binding protein
MTKNQLRDYRAASVAMIFQDPSAHVNPVRTVGDFLTEQLRVIRRTPAKQAYRRAAELLDEVRVPNAAERLGQYPHELSGGMLQRVMIAGALASEAPLLIADEPSTALDVTTQAEIMAILLELRRVHHLTLFMITHDLELAAAICDRTLVMYAGVIAESGTSAALHNRPVHPYTRALLASRPSLDNKPRRLPVITGRPLPAYDAPPGCAFAPRCPLATDICRETAPELRPVAGSWTACHHAELMAAPPAVAPAPEPS